MKRSPPLFIHIVFVVFLGFGLFVLAGAVHALWKENQSTSWPIVQGILIECQIKHNDDMDRVILKYTYAVDSTKYESSRIAYGYNASSDFNIHKNLFEKLRPLGSVKVRYNPMKPSEAVLADGVSNTIESQISFGIWWSLFTIAFYLILIFATEWKPERVEG